MTVHHQAWYWFLKPEQSVSSIRRVKENVAHLQHFFKVHLSIFCFCNIFFVWHVWWAFVLNQWKHAIKFHGKWKLEKLSTHWGRATHICLSKLSINGSDTGNGLSPGWHQAIIWTNAGIVLIGTLGTNFSEILSETHTFSFKKIRLKMSSGKWRPSCLGLTVLTVFCDILKLHLLLLLFLNWVSWNPSSWTTTCLSHIVNTVYTWRRQSLKYTGGPVPETSKISPVQHNNCICWSERPAISSVFWKFPLPKYCCSKHVSKFKAV